MTKQRKSKIQPKRSFRAFSVLRHPNHFLLAGVGRLALVSLRNRTAKEEDGKTLEYDKRDGAITCVFCREFT